MPNLTDGEMRDEYAVFGTVASRGRPNGRRSTITFRRQYSCELDSIHLSDRSRLRRFARSDLRAHRHGFDAAHCSGCPLSSHDCSPLLGGSDFRYGRRTDWSYLRSGNAGADTPWAWTSHYDEPFTRTGSRTHCELWKGHFYNDGYEPCTQCKQFILITEDVARQ